MNFKFISLLDIPVQGQIGFPDAATAVMHGIINLHHHIFFFLIIVCILVFYIFFRTYKFSVWRDILNIDLMLVAAFNVAQGKQLCPCVMSGICDCKRVTTHNIKILAKWYKYDVAHAKVLEIIWTVIPSLILLCIVGPSFALLYAMDAPLNPEITIKITGHQWYWSYEYTGTGMAKEAYFLNGNPQSFSFLKFVNYFNFYRHPWAGTHESFVANMSDRFKHIDIMEFRPVNLVQYGVSLDSYMIATGDLAEGELRLLEVDNALYVPIYTKIRLDITADDVIHAFAVPSLGIKVDAIPGRLNVAYLNILRPGIYFGQCSELCGVNHGFMPIKIIAVDFSDFFNLNLMLSNKPEILWSKRLPDTLQA